MKNRYWAIKCTADEDIRTDYYVHVWKMNAHFVLTIKKLLRVGQTFDKEKSSLCLFLLTDDIVDPTPSHDACVLQNPADNFFFFSTYIYIYHLSFLPCYISTKWH